MAGDWTPEKIEPILPQEWDVVSHVPTLADAWDVNGPAIAQNMRDTMTAVQDPQTWTDAAREYGQALVAGTGVGGGGIRAFHGSPHSFDKFDIGKIGTGEGAQTEGHGLYFAGNEGVARWYRDKLTEDMYRAPDGTVFDPHSQLQHINVRVAARKNGPDLDATITRAQGLLADASDSTRPMLEQDIALLQSFKDAGGITKNPGSMYEVSLNANPDHLLDWDTPISRQSDQVQAAIAKAAGGEIPPQIMDMTGRELYQRTAGGGEPAAKVMKDKFGLQGIKYLDADSRAEGEGSHNYVMFDDATIELLRKYGLAGLMAGGGAAAMAQPADAAPARDQQTGGSEGNGALMSGSVATYDTPLSPADEAAYVKWAIANGRTNDTEDYDMRGAFKAGTGASGNGHFTDQFKKPWHPTFSDQSQYHGVDGNQGGTWTPLSDGRYAFTPGPTNMKNWPVAALQAYWDKVEAPAGNVLNLHGAAAVAQPVDAAPAQDAPALTDGWQPVARERIDLAPVAAP